MDNPFLYIALFIAFLTPTIISYLKIKNIFIVVGIHAVLFGIILYLIIDTPSIKEGLTDGSSISPSGLLTPFKIIKNGEKITSSLSGGFAEIKGAKITIFSPDIYGTNTTIQPSVTVWNNTDSVTTITSEGGIFHGNLGTRTNTIILNKNSLRKFMSDGSDWIVTDATEFSNLYENKLNLPNNTTLSADSDNATQWLRLQQTNNPNQYKSFAAQDLWCDNGILYPGLIVLGSKDGEREENAGKIGYGVFGNKDSLDIVGKGKTTGTRKIFLYDEVQIGNKLIVNNRNILDELNKLNVLLSRNILDELNRLNAFFPDNSTLKLRDSSNNVDSSIVLSGEFFHFTGPNGKGARRIAASEFRKWSGW